MDELFEAWMSFGILLPSWLQTHGTQVPVEARAEA